MSIHDIAKFLKTTNLNQATNPVAEMKYMDSDASLSTCVRQVMDLLKATDRSWNENGSASFTFTNVSLQFCSVNIHSIKGGFRIVLTLEEDYPTQSAPSSKGKVLIQSRDSVIQVLAEVLDTRDNMSADFIKSDLWFFDNVCFKTQKSLIDAALKIIDNVESACFFNDQRKVWNPERDLTYRDTYDFLSNPNACVRLVVKDSLDELHEVEISAYGSIRIGCDFKSVKFDRGAHETGNSL